MTHSVPDPALVPNDIRQALPKYRQVWAALRERIRLLAPGAPLPSIATLQKEYGVSLATVNRALALLRQEGRIDVRHGSGIYVARNAQTMAIGVYIAFDVMHPEAGVFPRLLLRGLERAAGVCPDVAFRQYFAAGSECLWQDRVCLLEGDVRRRLLAGVIVVGVYGGAVGDLQVPTVGLHRLPMVTTHVGLDEPALVRMAVAALAARGCRKIALLGGAPRPHDPAREPYAGREAEERERYEAFLAAVSAAGLTTRPEWHTPPLETGVSSVVAAGRTEFSRIWGASHDKPDGLVSVDDYRTVGALAAMDEVGLAPGRDLWIASHTNRGSDVLAAAPVVRIAFDPDEIALAMVETVRALVLRTTTVPASVRVAPQLVEV